MYTETEHDFGIWSIHCKSAETVAGKRYGCIGDMVEIGKVCPKIFKREEVVRRNGKDSCPRETRRHY